MGEMRSLNFHWFMKLASPERMQFVIFASGSQNLRKKRRFLRYREPWVFVQAAVIRSCWELIRLVCTLMRSINSFHNRLMLNHKLISLEVFNTEIWLTFQFLVICYVEFRYSFVFLPICWEITFSFFRQKSIDTAVVTEQTSEAFDWKLIGFI